MIKISRNILLLFLTVLVMGCTNVNLATPTGLVSTNTPTDVTVLTHTVRPITPVPQAQPTRSINQTTAASPLPTTISSSLTPTVESDQRQTIRKSCLDVPSDSKPDLIHPGVIVYLDYREESFLWNTVSNEKIQFEISPAAGFSVSPDKTLVLYDALNQTTVIADADGSTVWSRKDEIYNVFEWLDNKHVLRHEPQPDLYPKLSRIDIYTNQEQSLRSQFPDLAKAGQTLWDYGNVKYNAVLSYAIYPAFDGIRIQIGMGGESPVVLWDLNADRSVGEIVTRYYQYGHTPIWLPDVSGFIIAADAYPVDPREPLFMAYEIFQMDVDGTIHQLTHFMDEFENAEIYRKYSLSPDGRYLAFWLSASPGHEENSLMVLNLTTGEITDYCIKGVPYLDNQTPDSVSAPVWSPDSSQILVLTQPDDDAQKNVVLVDILNKFATKIGESVQPIGWMIAP